MANLAIRVQDLGKRYRLGSMASLDRTFREAIYEKVGYLGRLLTGAGRNGEAAERDDAFWALRDINFDIHEGEVVGIIGHNGAGKSTLLKILSRITDPSRGRAEIYGRVGSLLEVGTGFHPELSGRENIFLNGAILGMSHAEIKSKFDEIVAFSEIEQFLDTPAKRYSSGMYVRLAFAVAAHLDPEILIVDEVLAVGDAKFQQRCLDKMRSVATSGRTVLFVSHNMSAVQALCSRAMVFSHGRVVQDGPVAEAITGYLDSLHEAARGELASRTDRQGKGGVRVTKIEITGAGEGPSVVAIGSPMRVTVTASGPLDNVVCWLGIYTMTGQLVTSLSNWRSGDEVERTGDQPNQLVCDVDELVLRAGPYRVDVELVRDRAVEDFVVGATVFNVAQGLVRGRSVPGRGRFGAVWMPQQWLLRNESSGAQVSSNG